MIHATDLSGIGVSLDRQHIPTWNRVVTGILSHGESTAADLNEVIAKAPDFALAQAVRGLACLLLGRPEMFAVAQEAYREALAAAKRLPPTAAETGFIDALGLWLQGCPSAAADRLQRVLDDDPRDALAMKMVQAIQFVMGRPDVMRRSAEALLPHWEGHAAKGYLLGCHAFTLEETGEYALAERAGMRAVELAPNDAWGLHAVAHVYDTTGRAQEGLDWLHGREASWAHCNNFRFHVWWHQALMYLDLGDFDAALDLYDTEIRREKTDDYRDIANATSLLARLEIEGIAVGDRWEEVADLSDRRAGDGCLAFADLHYLLALIGGKREGAAARLIGNMARARASDGEAKAIIGRNGHNTALGLQAYAAGNYSASWLHLRKALSDLQVIGGSHAQRDVFTRIAIEAGLRGGYLDETENLLNERINARGGHQDGYTGRRLEFLASVRASARETQIRSSGIEEAI
ncbi:tetratricopeptide repeat protein [Paracoccus alkanivorans]|uniref:Tetratricopeptide repeat protein 38 n=1 Tax=Paracoccus alkanivorans TaxID=2116655 RepID=A0A3M0MIH5_9RHOB|nr:tetratricopeptide repeat protein [Paracoccus alkanivorans]RMC35440.1 tetratricopeptide repeat protein [Paracoccus alkanivorans]